MYFSCPAQSILSVYPVQVHSQCRLNILILLIPILLGEGSFKLGTYSHVRCRHRCLGFGHMLDPGTSGPCQYIQGLSVCLGIIGTLKGLSLCSGVCQYVWEPLGCLETFNGLSYHYKSTNKPLLCCKHYEHQELLG